MFVQAVKEQMMWSASRVTSSSAQGIHAATTGSTVMRARMNRDAHVSGSETERGREGMRKLVFWCLSVSV